MIYTLATPSWTDPFSLVEREKAIEALEEGKVIYLPQLSFEFAVGEKKFLTPEVLVEGPKNISFNLLSGQLKGFNQMGWGGESMGCMAALMMRFAKQSQGLLERLMPQYQSALQVGRTSYRPVEIEGRKSSILKDDTRLHVDAFPATPNQGKRILRVFSNVNPEGKTRHWHLGEPFEKVVNDFKNTFRRPFWGSHRLLSWLKITKSYRSLYDHYMLTLHNQMKLSEDYQQQVTKTTMHFPPGSTWIVMTDQVSHAALSGQYLLEQTFYLPVEGMQRPEKSPLKVLERVLERPLVA